MEQNTLLDNLFLETTLYWEKRQQAHLSDRLSSLLRSKTFKTGKAILRARSNPVRGVRDAYEAIFRSESQIEPLPMDLPPPKLEANAVVLHSSSSELHTIFHAKFSRLDISYKIDAPSATRFTVFLEPEAHSETPEELTGWVKNSKGVFYRYIEAPKGRLSVSMPAWNDGLLNLRILPSDESTPTTAITLWLKPVKESIINLSLHEKLSGWDLAHQLQDQPHELSLQKNKGNELRLSVAHPANQRTRLIVPWIDAADNISKPAILRILAVRRNGTSLLETDISHFNALGFSYSKSRGWFKYAAASSFGILSAVIEPYGRDLQIDCCLEPWHADQLLVNVRSVRLCREDKGPVSTKPFFSGRFHNIERSRSVSSLRVAGIADPMSTTALDGATQYTPLSRKNASQELAQIKPDLLFVESAWEGNSGSWQYGIGHYPGGSNLDILRLVHSARAQSVPSLFWNKEDPIHFDTFIGTAQAFDHILTTDINCVDRYRNSGCREDARISVMPFFVLPSLHNPFFRSDPQNGVCFAGSYYGDRHPGRSKYQEQMLCAFREQGLVIYDRNHNSPQSPFVYPDSLADYVVGGVAHDKMPEIYKSFDWFLNVNTVTDSETMYARRVPELLACGTGVISNPSVGIRKTFGPSVPEWTDTTHAEILEIIANPNSVEQRLRLAIRTLFDHAMEVYLASVATAVTGNRFTAGWRDFALVFVNDGQANFTADCLSSVNKLLQAGLAPAAIINVAADDSIEVSAWPEQTPIPYAVLRFSDRAELVALAKKDKRLIFVPDPASLTPDSLRSLLVTAHILKSSATALSSAQLDCMTHLAANLQSSAVAVDSPWLIQPQAVHAFLTARIDRPWDPTAIGLPTTLAPNL